MISNRYFVALPIYFFIQLAFQTVQKVKSVQINIPANYLRKN